MPVQFEERFELTDVAKVEKFFNDVNQYLNKDYEKYESPEKLLSVFNNYTNYFWDNFGNFISGQNESALDILVLNINDGDSDIVLWYYGQIGVNGKLGYMVDRSQCIDIEDKITNYETFAAVIKREKEFMEYVTNNFSQLLVNEFKVIRDIYFRKQTS